MIDYLNWIIVAVLEHPWSFAELGGAMGAWSACFTWRDSRRRIWVRASYEMNYYWVGDEQESECILFLDVTNPTSRRLTVTDVRLASYRNFLQKVLRRKPVRALIKVSRRKPVSLVASDCLSFEFDLDEIQNFSGRYVYAEARHSGSAKWTRAHLRQETPYYQKWRYRLQMYFYELRHGKMPDPFEMEAPF